MHPRSQKDHPERALIVRRTGKTLGEDSNDSKGLKKRWNIEIYFSGLKRAKEERIKAAILNPCFRRLP